MLKVPSNQQLSPLLSRGEEKLTFSNELQKATAMTCLFSSYRLIFSNGSIADSRYSLQKCTRLNWGIPGTLPELFHEPEQDRRSAFRGAHGPQNAFQIAFSHRAIKQNDDLIGQFAAIFPAFVERNKNVLAEGSFIGSD